MMLAAPAMIRPLPARPAVMAWWLRRAAPDGEQIHHRGDQRDEQAAEHHQQQDEGQQHHHGDEQRQLAGEHGGEVDVAGGHPADVHDQAGTMGGLRDEVLAQVVHQVDGRPVLRAGGRVDGGQLDLPGSWSRSGRAWPTQSWSSACGPSSPGRS